jgi:hypothetical protein
MNERRQPSIAERFADDPVITAALCRAGRAAVLSHARAGNPIAVWREGRVVWLQPEEVLASLALEATRDDSQTSQ